MELKFICSRRKGFVHMIEAFIAIIFIFTFLIVLKEKLQPTADTGLEQAIAFQTLQSLDKQENLRSYVINEDTLGLNTQVNQLITSDFNHTIDICYLGERCVGDTLQNTTIYTASYTIAGNATTFKPARILLHIWRR